MLNNIAIRFNKKDFEYDVYSLVKAFYPQAQITMFYEGEEEAEGEYGMFLLVAYGSQEICLAVERDGTEIFRQQVAVEYEKDRPETKNVLKRLVYGALCQVTGRTLPWGDLTGIRPTKIPMKLLEEGWKNTEIARYMRETYGVSNEKTALAITIANREKALLQDLDYENGYSLYVGIPFCPSICLYCSFGSHPLERWTKRVGEYLDTLCKELTFIREQMGTRKLTQDYVEMHLEDAAAFIPYGCMVDEFQHIVYEHPELTPAERKQAWSRLEREYKPHLDYEGDPFFGQGGFWQKQLHIYDYPLYYIDYCLAQTCALQYEVKMDADFTESSGIRWLWIGSMKRT